jgi:hypothetical protein
MNIMDEKPIESKEEKPVEGKKPYTAPGLTVYGKLTELTAAGTPNKAENSNPPNPSDPFRMS